MSNINEAKYLSAFGKRLAQIRKERGYTQERLAEKADISSLSLSFIEQGRRWPRIATLHKIAICLDVSIDDLFKGLKS